MKIAGIVRSEAGHDKGSCFFVVGEEGEYLYLADGKTRKAAAPKRKKTKHVSFLEESRTPLAEKIRQGESVTNKEIKRTLARWRASATS
ncbi:MAG: KOW domain-containing RNA-binding protein [Oscillospiraceae bacterium]|nr:KOW domain-containing RNA-binding protein [Oscillospiraceae bacterium]